jgi:energy-coupling factor transporter ATP-binding protein EcfA2
MARNPFLLDHIIESQRKIVRIKGFEKSFGNFLKYFSVLAFAFLNVMFLFRGRFLIGEIFTPGVFDLTTLVNLVLFSTLLYACYLTRDNKHIDVTSFSQNNPVTEKYLQLISPKLLEQIFESTYQGETIKLDFIKFTDELIETEAANKELLLRMGLEGLEIKQLMTALSENFINENRFFANYNFNELLESAKNLYPSLNATEIDTTAMLFSIIKDLPKELLEKFEITEEKIYGATTWLKARYLKLYFISEIVRNHIKKDYFSTSQHLASRNDTPNDSSCFSSFENLTQELVTEIRHLHKLEDNYLYPFTYRFGDLTEVIDNLEQPTSLNLIIGNSQSGKTTLIKSLALTLLNLQKHDPLKGYEIVELKTKQLLREASSINAVVNSIKAMCEEEHQTESNRQKTILFIDDFGELMKVDDHLSQKILALLKKYKENNSPVKLIATMKKHEFDFFNSPSQLDYIFEQINLEPHASSIVSQIMIDKYLHSSEEMNSHTTDAINLEKLQSDPKPNTLTIQDAFKRDTNGLSLLQEKYEQNKQDDSNEPTLIILNSQSGQYQHRVCKKITEKIFGSPNLMHILNIKTYRDLKDLNKLKQELAVHVTSKPYSSIVIADADQIAVNSNLEKFLLESLESGYFEYRSASFREEERIDLSNNLIILQTSMQKPEKFNPRLKSHARYIFNLQPVFKLQTNSLIDYLLNEYETKLKDKGLEVVDKQEITQKIQEKVKQFNQKDIAKQNGLFKQIEQEIEQLMTQRIEQKMLTGQLKPGDTLKL